jgi:amidase
MAILPEYDRYDALGLAELVRRREVTPAELLEEAISRTERINPALNAVISTFYERARRQAAGDPGSGPFAGVPFLLKDLLHALAGVPLSSGSTALRSWTPDRNSELVDRFLAAGLIPFGKTNTPEFGLLAVTEPEAFGPTHNPWDLTRTPGGSSGGAGAAVAAGLVPMASAGDGGGSIRIPAAACGLFGLRPSRGRTPSGPRFGEVWEGAVSDLCVSRSVRDSAALLDAVEGAAEGDPFVAAPPARPYVEEVGADPGILRIAFSTRSAIGPVDPEYVAAVHRTAALLEDLGHRVEEAEPEVDGEAVAHCYLTLYFGQVAADLRLLDRERGAGARRQTEAATRTLGLIGEALPAAEYVDQHRAWNGFARAVGVFERRHDLYLTPTIAGPPVRIGELAPRPADRMAMRLAEALHAGRLVRASGMVRRMAIQNLARTPFTQLANLTGRPAMSVPVEWGEGGLPIGMHFMAAWGGEDVLLRLASQLEEARPWSERRPPPPSTGLRG